jgi:Asp-tRNA(Asn)/Glu-tRNA(Gln) amidotransferase A subunit family amidase
MAEMTRAGAVSPRELVEAHLAQIRPEINAFVAVREQAIEEAQRLSPGGLLRGVPLTVKDSFDVAGMPTRSGSRLRLAMPAAADAPAVARLRAAGAVVIGKTNTPELLASYETDNYLTGRTNNPWDLERTPGGSSGGEAAAIASLCSAGGVGSDGGGSIRVPAHFCGIAGLKPTPGRVPGTGHYPSIGYPGGLVGVAGPMARTAEDLRLLFSVLAGYDPEDPFSVPVPLSEPCRELPRVGVWEQFYGVSVDPEIRDAVRRAARLLNAGEFTPAGLERAPNLWAFLFAQWPASTVRRFIEGREADAHWTLMETLGPAASPDGEQVLLSLAARDRMRASLLRQMRDVPVIVMPVCSIPAFRHRERRFNIEGREIGLFQAMMPVVIANVLGLPAVTVPMAMSSAGLPIGVQLLGRPFEDEQLLEVAIRLEAARGPFTAYRPFRPS